MFKTYSPAAKIASVSILISAIGFSLDFATIHFTHFFFRVLIGFFQPITLQWGAVYSKPGFVSINQVFYLLLFAGGIIAFISKYRETRLIRFVFSLIFLSGIVLSTALIINYTLYFKLSGDYVLALLQISFFLLERMFWICVSFQILKYFNTAKNIQRDERIYEQIQLVQYEAAGLWQRAFHIITDSLIISLMFYWLYDNLLRIFVLHKIQLILQSHLGKVTYFFLIVAYFRVVYYFITEYILGASPAKFLTETRIIDQDGNKPNAGQILIRTLSRLVPFEWVSNLEERPWHDRWAKVSVVKEEQTGVNGARYFWIIPAYILLAIIWIVAKRFLYN